MEPTISQVFGTGATRLANAAAAPSAGLFIPDSVFVATGLTAPATATAEGHLVSLLIQAKNYLTQTKFDANIDQSIFIADGFTSFQQRGTDNDNYRIDQPFVVNLARIDDGTTINPNNY
ncbi:hypothetical protein [Sphaerospermopsis torques-reginae]|uniref:Uncharacterized protein n=1 Tax=Sphaerospermopsis torques-reginae ITEP-024 TaxID=984208 RepID=A0ABX8WVB1_9CYAN|nr:hypothetical protein [Sphaerospermopsis torques-reginae]QYX30061.1 hypothetical protein K2F26_13925 [Sphaerospermopsis torques-reginae ITEP-024]